MWQVKLSTILLFLFQLVACGGGGGGGTDAPAEDKSSQPSIDFNLDIAINSSETTPVLTATSNTIGNAAIEGSCSADDVEISVGLNHISLNELSDGVYSDCAIAFTTNNGEFNRFPIPEFEIDTRAPVIQSDYIIPPFLSDSTPEFKFNSTEEGRLSLTGQCQVAAEHIVVGDNTIQLSALPDGIYSDCQIRVTDKAGNLSNIIEINSFNLDSQFPNIMIESITDPFVKSLDANISISSNEHVTFTLSNECESLSLIDGEIGINELSLTSLGEGVFVNCTLLATDRAGNRSQALAIPPFTIDDTSPIITEISPVTSPTNSRENNLNLRLNEDGRFTASGNCHVVSDLFLSGDQFLAVTVEGDEEVTSSSCDIRFSDRAGNTSAKIELTSFTVDSLGPELLINSAVSGVTSDNTPQIILSSNEDASLEYGSICTSLTTNILKGSNTVELNQLAEGEYLECRVRAFDSLNNYSEWLNLPVFKVDITKPLLTIVKDVSAKSDNKMPSLVFNSSEVGIVILNGSCDSEFTNAVKGQNHLTINELHTGKYDDCSLTVTDEAGNQSELLSIAGFEIVPLPVALAIWQGGEDSIIAPLSPNSDFMLYRSRQENCDLDNYAACNSGQVNALSDSRIVDTAFNRTNNAFAKIRTNNSVESPDALLTTSSGLFTYPESQTIVFNGNIFSYDANSPAAFSRSNDGHYWQSNTVATEFGQRKGHQIVEFNNKLWMVAGVNDNEYSSDVWSSFDGVSWRYESTVEDVLHNSTVILNGRSGHQVVVFKEKLWLIGGISKGGYEADVWSSSNGRFWDRETDFAPFGRRANHKAVVYEDKIYVIGGHSSSSFEFDDIWSFDGSKWQKESDANPFGGRYGMDIEFFNGKWNLVGGYDASSFPNSKKDVWQSDNLIEWTKLTDDANLGKTEHQQLFVFKEKLWITGAEGIRFSENAAEWKTFEKDQYSYSSRNAHGAVNFKGEFWLVGGIGAGESSGDIYRSADGVRWQLVSETAPFGSRENHTLTEFKGRLWIIAGDTSNGLSNDVWVSDDGIAWELVIEQAEFTKREGHMVVATETTLYLMGGDDDSGFWNLKDVWSSTDGENWNLINSSAGYKQDLIPDAEYFDNKLWVFDGSKIYSANIETPGTWSQVGTVSQAAHYNEVEIHNGQLMMYTYSGKLLSSSDGLTWVEITSDEYRLPTQLQNSQLVSKDGHLWLLGGRLSASNSYSGSTWRYSAADGWRLLIKRDIPFY